MKGIIPNFRIRLKAYLPLNNPAINSIVDIYNGANWMERETYDFFGIIFKGHPNLTRILNMDEIKNLALSKLIKKVKIPKPP